MFKSKFLPQHYKLTVTERLSHACLNRFRFSAFLQPDLIPCGQEEDQFLCHVRQEGTIELSQAGGQSGMSFPLVCDKPVFSPGTESCFFLR